MILLFSYAISVYYVSKHRDEPVKVGVTFVPNYAKYFDLDPQETFDAMINDLGFERVRLVSYWSDIEKKKGV